MTKPYLLALALTALAAWRSPGADLPALRVQGTALRDAAGKPVTLRGFNVGNWLVNEVWMTPVAKREAPADYRGATQKITDHATMWGLVQERFGVAGRVKLQEAWRDAWLDESDFRRMKEAGTNCVRLPFSADNLLGDDPTKDILVIDPATLTDSSLDWRRLDQAVGWARKHGLYVVLDLHGAPGRQSVEHHTGREGVNKLWTDPRAARLAEKVWELVAAHYKGDATIAAADLLNEPRALPGDREDANATAIHAMHDRLTRAVRKGDPGRIVVIEDGFSGFNRMPRPARAGWTNVVYSYHSYPDSRERLRHTLSDWEFKDCRERGVPFYLGEFSLAMHPGKFQWPSDLGFAVAAMDSRGISWSAWNYKIAPADPAWRGTHWGWYRNDDALDRLDLWRDDLATLIRETAAVKTANLKADPAWDAALRGK